MMHLFFFKILKKIIFAYLDRGSYEKFNKSTINNVIYEFLIPLKTPKTPQISLKAILYKYLFD